MSLINEALKQAEKDKRRNSGDAFDSPALEPVDDRSAQWAGGRTLLVLLLLAFVGATGWAIYEKIAAGNGIPRIASADAAPARKADPAPRADNSQTPKPQAVTNGESVETPAVKPQADRAEQPEITEKAVAADPDVELAFAKTLDAIRYYKPPRQKAARKKANTKSAKPPKVDPPRFKVSAIISSPGGANAIINGALVGVGGTVGGAKVIRITRAAVELELDGKRFTVGM